MRLHFQHQSDIIALLKKSEDELEIIFDKFQLLIRTNNKTIMLKIKFLKTIQFYGFMTKYGGLFFNRYWLYIWFVFGILI